MMSMNVQTINNLISNKVFLSLHGILWLSRNSLFQSIPTHVEGVQRLALSA